MSGKKRGLQLAQMHQILKFSMVVMRSTGFRSSFNIPKMERHAILIWFEMLITIQRFTVETIYLYSPAQFVFAKG
jgi:hypothetical protein